MNFVTLISKNPMTTIYSKYKMRDKIINTQQMYNPTLTWIRIQSNSLIEYIDKTPQIPNNVSHHH